MDLKTGIWVGALARRAELGGAFATIVRHGDDDAGGVVVKVRTRDGRARLYAPALRGEDETVFLDLSAGALGVDEAAVDAAIARRVKDDPDLWVIEIEDRAGRHFLTERVLQD